ncbi:MAG: GntR family transcriptional regulator [Methanosarcinaceae archaeon]
MGRIDKSSIVPKYYQLKELLKEKIAAGNWKPGEKIPAEKELVNNYDCSLITVNKAVSKLVEEGYVFRERGRGTYVSSKSLWGKADGPIVLKLIGMVVPDVSNEFGRAIVRGVEDFLHTRGYSLILGNHDQNYEKAVGYSSLLLKKNIDGIIISPVVGENYEEKNARIVKKLSNRDIPYVLIDKYLRNTDSSYVVSDSIESSYKMTTYLIKSGHQKIGVLSGLDCSSFEDRLTGYRNALEKNEIPYDPDLVFECDERRIDACDVEMIKQFLKTNASFTAIFTFNATLAKGAILALEKLGQRVPGDITLVTYDNHILPNLAEDLFTRVDQPIYKMGEKAAELLIQMIEKGIRKPKKVILKSEILAGKQDDIIVSS